MNYFRTGMILFIGLLSSPFISPAQTINFSWAKQIGNTNEDRGYSIATDLLGNVYTAGNFKGTMDFDPGTGNYPMSADAANGDIFITKFDAAGNFIWAKQLSGEGREDYPVITLDGTGSLFCGGQFIGDTIDVDPGPGTFYLVNSDVGGIDLFVAKLDTGGNFIWGKLLNADGGSYNYIRCMKKGQSGHLYITGSFSYTFDFDPGAGSFPLSTTTVGIEDAFILKLGPAGDFIWARQLGGDRYDGANSMDLDDNENVYTTGYFGGTADFDPGPGTYNLVSPFDYQTFLSKLDSAGNLIWAKPISGSGTSIGYGLLYDQKTSLYCAGGFGGTMDFDPGSGTQTEITNGDYDQFLLKTDTAGNFNWVKRFTGSGGGFAYQLAYDTAFNLYLSGLLQDTTDFDPGPGVYKLVSNSGSIDIFICKLDSAGNFKWALKVGGSGHDWIQGLSVDTSNNVYATGYFSGTVDFNPGAGTFNLASAGSDDIFILKLSQSTATGSYKNEFNEMIRVYPNPTKDRFTIDLGRSYNDVVLKFMDVSGREVQSATFRSCQFIQTEIKQPAGIYFISIIAEGQEAGLKLIKN